VEFLSSPSRTKKIGSEGKGRFGRYMREMWFRNREMWFRNILLWNFNQQGQGGRRQE